jgi:hypothetical protein
VSEAWTGGDDHAECAGIDRVGRDRRHRIIGYSSLLVAQNLGLYYFGFLAVLGEITCLTVAVVVLPAALLLWRRRRNGNGNGNVTPAAASP